jgi:hypothetical protein
MADDPINLLKSALRSQTSSAESPAGELLAPLRRLIDICDAGDKVSRAVRAAAPSGSSNLKIVGKTMNNHAPSSPRGNQPDELAINLRAIPVLLALHGRFPALEKSVAEMSKDIAVFREAICKIFDLKDLGIGEKCFEKVVAAVDKVMTAMENVDPHPNDLIAKAKKAIGAMSDCGRRIQKTRFDLGMCASEGKTYLIEADLDAGLDDRIYALDDRLHNVSDENFSFCVCGEWSSGGMNGARDSNYDIVKELKALRDQILSFRKEFTAIPGLDKRLKDWCLEWEDAKDTPGFYREINVEAARRALEETLEECLTRIDALQPRFERISAESVNVGTEFPSCLVIGEHDFSDDDDDVVREAAKGFSYMRKMPESVKFPFTTPLSFDSEDESENDALQMLVFRMAQALPLGLFEVHVVDSHEAGQTFRAISALRKSGIANISSKRDDDEKILSALDSWLGELSDRGCWDDSENWGEYNHRHPDAPIPFKLVVFPTFAALDAVELAVVAKLAKSGPAAGVVPVFSVQGVEGYMKSRGDESSAPAISALSKTFTRLSNLLAGCHTLGLPPPEVRAAVAEALAEARGAVEERQSAASALDIGDISGQCPVWSGDATDGLSFQIGVSEGGTPLVLEIGDANVHGLVGGMTGSGKSNLLHDIIHSLCWKYSPAEVELHLLDYKDGMEFKVYSDEDETCVWLPHVKTISTHNDPAYALTLFDELQRETMRRKRAFGKARSYREFRRNGGSLPRVFVLIDEFHKLFEGDERVEVADRIMQILKQGRSYGIHLLASTQTLSGIDADLSAMKGQIGVRLALRGNDGDGILDVDNDAATRIERPMCVFNDRAGQTSGNRLFRVPFIDIASKAEEAFRRKITEAAAKGRFACGGRIFRGTELPRRPDAAKLLEDAPATSGIAVRIGVCDDYLARPAFVTLDDAPNGHLLVAAPAGDEVLDEAGNLTCNGVLDGLFGTVLASLAATPDTAVLLYDPAGREPPVPLPDGWDFRGGGTAEEDLREALNTLAHSSAAHRVLVVDNWVKAVRLHPRNAPQSSYLDDAPAETARTVFASAFSPENEAVPFHAALFVRNFTYARRETFGGYDAPCDILKGCSQRIGVNLSESDLGELFPALPARGTAHRILAGSSYSDETFRFLPFRED